MTNSIDVAGIILAGGRSTRFGSDKAFALFHGEPLLQHAVNGLSSLANEILLVTSADTVLPEVGSIRPLRLVIDEIPDAGPLAGIQAGLAATTAEVAIITAVDIPGISPDLLAWMRDRIGKYDAVVPVEQGRTHLFPAILRRAAALEASLRLLHQGERRARLLFDALETDLVDGEELRELDPALLSLRNVNTPAELEELEAALASEAGASD